MPLEWKNGRSFCNWDGGNFEFFKCGGWNGWNLRPMLFRIGVNATGDAMTAEDLIGIKLQAHQFKRLGIKSLITAKNFDGWCGGGLFPGVQLLPQALAKFGQTFGRFCNRLGDNRCGF